MKHVIFFALILCPLVLASDDPSIDSITPKSSPTNGAAITIVGEYFGNEGKVNISGRTCNILVYSASKIVCETPSGSGVDQKVQVIVPDEDIAETKISYMPPSILRIEPTVGDTLGGTPITLIGTNFGDATQPSRRVTVGTEVAKLQVWEHTKVVFVLPNGSGNQKVTLEVNGQKSNSLDISYNAPFIHTNQTLTVATEGGEVALIGSNFGTSFQPGRKLLFNGKPVQIKSWEQDQILFVAPSGSGVGKTIELRVNGKKSNKVQLNYRAPFIAIHPLTADTKGGTLITIAGDHFGRRKEPKRNVTFGKTVIDEDDIVYWGDSRVIFKLPNGSGKNVTVVLGVNGQISNPAFFTYKVPIITSHAPTSLPTKGGDITIKGVNFGNSKQPGRTVSVNQRVVKIDDWEDDQVVIVVPEGSGQFLDIELIVNGQKSSPAKLNYDPPVIKEIDPEKELPTIGGKTVTIEGKNFGSDKEPKRKVFVGTKEITSFKKWKHDEIVFILPEGAGSQTVKLTVNGQTSNGMALRYEQPELHKLKLAANTTGGNKLTITGDNFGPALGYVHAVVVNGEELPAITWNHSRVVFELGPGSGKRNVALKVEGIVSNTVLVEYKSPRIAGISPNVAEPGSAITLTGDNFGSLRAPGRKVIVDEIEAELSAWDHKSIVAIIPPGKGTNKDVQVCVDGKCSNEVSFNYDIVDPDIDKITPKVFNTDGSTNVTIIGTRLGVFTRKNRTVTVGNSTVTDFYVWNTTTVIFSAPEGSGKDVILTLSVSGLTTDTYEINYNPPKISDKLLSAPTSGGDVTIHGKNFGNAKAAKRSVKFMGKEMIIRSWNHSEVVFVVPAGVGPNKDVVLSVNKQSAKIKFSYEPPFINSITPSSGPTQGGNLLTISGRSFGFQPSISVGQNLCPLTQTNHDNLVCRVPAGQGTKLPIRIVMGSQVSTTNITYSYDVPVVSGINPTEGSTTGSYLLTIMGSNFGLKPMVSIASLACNVTKSTHNDIVCLMSPGEGANLPITVSVGGQTNANSSVTFAFQPASITSLSHKSVLAGGGTLLTINGKFFGVSARSLPGKVSVVNAKDECVVTAWEDTKIVCKTPTAPAGNYTIMVQVPGASSIANKPSANLTYANVASLLEISDSSKRIDRLRRRLP